MREPVRLVLVDDSAGTRAMLQEALNLEDGMEVVGEAGGGWEAVGMVSQLRPDVVLMDIRMSEGDGVEAARLITSRWPAVRIVALTWSDDPATARAMVAAGAVGYVVKGGSIDELVKAIRLAADGRFGLDRRVASGFLPPTGDRVSPSS